MEDSSLWGKGLARQLSDFQRRGYLCDMDLLAQDGTPFKVHSCVVAASSSVLEAATSLWASHSDAETQQEKLVIATSVSTRIMPSLISCLYTGKGEADDENLEEVQQALLELDAKLPGTETSSSGNAESETPFYLEVQDQVVDSQGMKIEVHVQGDDTSAADVGTEPSSSISNLQMQETIKELLSPPEGAIVSIKEEVNDLPLVDIPSNLIDEANDCDNEYQELLDFACKEAIEKIGRVGGDPVMEEEGSRKEDVPPPEDNIVTPKEEITYDSDFEDKVKKKEKEKDNEYKNADGKWECPTCGNLYQRKIILQRHMVTHGDQLPYECEHCGNRYQRQSTLWRHQQTNHTQGRPHACKVCGKTYSARFVLQGHMRKVHKMTCPRSPKPELPHDHLQCKICKKVYKNTSHLNAHVRSVHSDARPYLCHTCGKNFKAKFTLKAHIGFVHKGVKRTKTRINGDPLRCTYCFKGFRVRHHLVVHERRHTGDKPYKCRFCEQSFVTSTERKGHEGKHQSTMPFQCTLCGKGFPRSGNLTSHLLTHSEHRPYACQTCGKGFKTRAHKTRHENLHSIKPTLEDLKPCY